MNAVRPLARSRNGRSVEAEAIHSWRNRYSIAARRMPVGTTIGLSKEGGRRPLLSPLGWP